MDTLATMRRQLITYLKDDEDIQLCNDAINDAIESLWQSCILIHLGQFMGGPVANLQLAAGSERVTLVSISDPVQLTGAQFSTVAQAVGPPPLPLRNAIYCITYVTESGSETIPDYEGQGNPVGNGTPLAEVVPAGFQSIITPPSYPNIPFPSYPPSANPIGYNVYAAVAIGVAPDPNGMVKQNGNLPIPFNQRWTELPSGIIIPGQSPSPPIVNNTADNIFFVRVLEVQNQDQTWTRWSAGSLDGLMMDRMVKRIAAQSSYERYAYDFVNGNTLEIRPALGQTLSPRYFFVVKPRRLLYDSAFIPFTNLPYTEFIKMFAGAQCLRSVREYTAASQADSAAERSKLDILKGLNVQATSKQKNITPYFRY